MRYLALVLLATAAFAGEPACVIVTAGALEAEFTDHGLDALFHRDRHLFGDPHSDRRPVAWPELLKPGWKTLWEPDSTVPIAVAETADGVVVKTAGVNREKDGSGRWAWTQVWTLTRAGQLKLDYTCRQTAVPTTKPWQSRVSFILNGNEVFTKPPNKDQHTPGREIPVTTRDGKTVDPRFGSPEAIVQQPQRVVLPYAGVTIPVTVSDTAQVVELWNGWWQQRMSFFLNLPTEAGVSTSVSIDLSALPQVTGQAQTIDRRPAVVEPWETGELPSLPVPQHPFRFGQNAPTIIAWGDVKSAPAEAQETFFEATSKHFEVLELMIGWTDWKYDLWQTDPKAKAHAEAIAKAAREELDLAAKYGLTLAPSFEFGGSGPGSGKLETRRMPHFQGETFDPETGEFTRQRDLFDWANPAAVEFARAGWRDAAKLIGRFDWLFYNEPHDNLQTWYKVPYFSGAALADFRRTVGDPAAKFPAKPYAKPTDRTDNQATPADWQRWREWCLDVYARRIQTLTEAVAEAQAENPDYHGAIYFQNVGWAVPKYGVDLDRVAAIPGIALLVAEYVTDADAEPWRRFKYFATKHHKPLASFVNLAQYDPDKPGRARFEGTAEQFGNAVRMGIDEQAAALVLYPVSPTIPSDPGYNEARTRLWDELTAPYVTR